MLSYLSVGIIAILVLASHTSAHCVNDRGATVGWWIIIKGAYIADSPNANARQGMSYVYMDSTAKQFTLSAKSLRDATNPLGRTLQQIYSSSATSSGYVMYNDETPDEKTSTSYAHAKGVVFFNSMGGFWLVHSTPRFPFGKSHARYEYPDFAKLYGQSFFCLSLDIGRIDLVALQLSYMNPQIYESNVPKSLAAQLPTLMRVLNGTDIKTRTPASHIQNLKVLSGVDVVSFAKNKPWNMDLYTNLVIPYINDGMLIETWMRPFEPSCCPKAAGCGLGSINVLKVRLDSHSTAIDYPETKDHAKWGISLTQKTGWTCIGDINRNTSQWKRGGGTVCIRDSAVWTAFHNLILEHDKC